MDGIAGKKEKKSSVMHHLRSVVTIRGVLAVELSSPLQTQHAATQDTPSALKSKSSPLKLSSNLKRHLQHLQNLQNSNPCKSLTQMLSDWRLEKDIQGAVVVHERLAFACENRRDELGTTAAKFELGLESLVELQCQQQQTQS
jgi:hypothetical protein